MNSLNPFVDFRKHCPHPKCGEPLGDSAHFCVQCGGAFCSCFNCQGANRLLAGYCRFCRQPMNGAVWPMEPGLIAKPEPANGIGEFTTVRKVETATPPVKVIASPIAADGIIIIAHSDGQLIVLSEHNLSEELFRFKLKEQISVTPALLDGFLYLAAENRLYAFDLAAALSEKTTQPIVWQADCDDLIVQPVLADGRNVYVVTQNGKVEAFRLARLVAVPQKAERAWMPQTVANSRTTSLMSVSRRLALFMFDGSLVTLNVETGSAQAFRNPAGIPHPNVAPHSAGEHVIFVNDKNQVCRLTFESSSPHAVFFEGRQEAIKSMAATEKFIAIGHSFGLVLLDDRGSKLWENTDVDQAITVTPVLTRQAVFALTSSGIGFKFGAINGNALDNRKFVSGGVGTPPLLTRSCLAAVSTEGEAAVLNLKAE